MVIATRPYLLLACLSETEMLLQIVKLNQEQALLLEKQFLLSRKIK